VDHGTVGIQTGLNVKGLSLKMSCHYILRLVTRRTFHYRSPMPVSEVV